MGSSKTKKGCSVKKVASGAPLLVDVEFGRGHRLYALSQGEGSPGAPEGSPAVPNTGALVEVKGDGTFTVVTDGLDQPTSLEFIGDTAYVVTSRRGDLEDRRRLGSARTELNADVRSATVRSICS